jgi:DNA-binding transcriptional LysR family regulator
MNLHTAMSVFVEVAKAGGFAEAARRLNLSSTAVSRHVADLERELGVTLLRRTTRHVSLTEAGARYLPRAAAVLDEVEALNAEISAVDTAPRGRLRVTAPPAIGNDWIARLAVDFAATYPEIELELDLTERVVDLVEEGYDAAIRGGALPSSSLIAHRIVEMRYRLCASPDYLARAGAPAGPEDIAVHQTVYWCGGMTTGKWTLSKDGERVSVPVRPRLRISHFASLQESARRGLGLAILPLISVREDLRAGRLVHVLPDWECDHGILSLVRPPTAFEPAKLRVFIDFITDALRRRAEDCP